MCYFKIGQKKTHPPPSCVHEYKLPPSSSATTNPYRPEWTLLFLSLDIVFSVAEFRFLKLFQVCICNISIDFFNLTRCVTTYLKSHLWPPTQDLMCFGAVTLKVVLLKRKEREEAGKGDGEEGRGKEKQLSCLNQMCCPYSMSKVQEMEGDLPLSTHMHRPQSLVGCQPPPLRRLPTADCPDCPCRCQTLMNCGTLVVV